MTSVPPAERMTEDDRAQAAEEQWRAAALEAQRIAAARSVRDWVPGVCRNCAEQPIAGLYCCPECRERYERRARRG